MIWGLIATIYVSICMSLICRKMGFPPILGVLTLVPALGWLLFIVLLWYMGFARWPRWPVEAAPDSFQEA